LAGLSSVTPSVSDRPPHQHPACHVEERQAASLGLLAEPADRDVNILLNPIWTSGVKQSGTLNAQTTSVVNDAKGPQELFQFSADHGTLHLKREAIVFIWDMNNYS